jgi:FixJ family two-component response regulator
MVDDAVIHIIDDDESLRAALDSLFRSTGLATNLHDSVASFLKAAPSQNKPGCLSLSY